MLTAPMPQAAFALGLLLTQAFRWTWLRRPHLRLAVSLLTLLLLPVVLHPVLELQLPGGNNDPMFLPGLTNGLTANSLLAVAVALPVLIFVVSDLKLGNLSREYRLESAGYLRLSGTAIALGMTFLLLAFFSVIVDSALLFTISVIILLVLLSGVFRAWRYLKGEAIGFSVMPDVRIMAGKPDAVKLDLLLRTINKTALICKIQPEHSWIRIENSLISSKGETIVKVSVKTPPLAGFFQPTFNLVCSDPAGLVLKQHSVQPLKIEVIPRSAYVTLLARRYLSGGGGVFGGSGLLNLSSFKKAGRGLDYLGSRQYQAGDRLKEIDWKHSVKFQSGITKEYARGASRSAVILGCLDAADEITADKLAFNLISSALTLAQEAIPTGVCLFNNDEILKYSPVGNPDAVLKYMLGMIKLIRLRPPADRRLNPVDITALRRSISLLCRVAGEETQGLLSLLDFEKAAIKNAADVHPLAQGINRLCHDLSRPATVIMASVSEENPEVTALALETLRASGYEIIFMAAEGARPAVRQHQPVVSHV